MTAKKQINVEQNTKIFFFFLNKAAKFWHLKPSTLILLHQMCVVIRTKCFLCQRQWGIIISKTNKQTNKKLTIHEETIVREGLKVESITICKI